MLIHASAIVAILARRPEAETLLARLDAAGGPFFATPVDLLVAVADLARLKAAPGDPTPALLTRAHDAVAEFTLALGLREIPISADLGRRAMGRLTAEGAEPGRCLAEACAAAYRVPLLAT